MRRARIILLVVGLLLAGVVVNVGVAWACARWGDHDELPRKARWGSGELWAAGARDYLSDPAIAGHLGVVGSASPTTTVHHSFTCSTVVFSTPNGSVATPHYTLTRFGLPLRSMEFAEQGVSDTITGWGGGSSPVPGRAGGWPRARGFLNAASGSLPPPRIETSVVYPLTILPLPFAINTVVYAAVLSPLTRGVVALRRRSRLRKGVCPRCEYPIGVSPVCTECGTRLPVVAGK